MSGSKRRRPREMSRPPLTPTEHMVVEVLIAGHAVNPEQAARAHLQRIVLDLQSGRMPPRAYRERLVASLQGELDGKPFAKTFGLRRPQRTKAMRTLVRDAWIAVDYVLCMRDGGKAAAVVQELAVLWGVANARRVIEAAHTKLGDLARFAIRDQVSLRADVYGETEARVIAGFRQRTDAARAEWLAGSGETTEK